MTQTIPPNPNLPASPDAPPTGPRTAPPFWMSVTYGVAVVAVMAWLRLFVFNDRLLAIGYAVPLCGFLWLRNRQALWICAAAFGLIEIVGILYVVPAKNPAFPWRDHLVVALAFSLLDLSVISVVVHLLVGALGRNERFTANLMESNAELAAREEEIARQNEELQSQTEELERQSEELRASNEELSRHERMLESLLRLSRTLTADMSRQETMDKICQTLGELVNGPHTAAAIKVRQGDDMVIVCHSGFGPDGPEVDRIPYSRAFAQLILERGRTGYIEDIELRPELSIPQPKTGPRHRSVLAAPLRVGRKTTGSLEVYHIERHTWTDEQITLVESLAAQTSISLEAAELFEGIESERRRLKAVLDTVPFGVAIVDPDGNSMRMNPHGAAMFNVPPDAPLDARYRESRWKVFRPDGKPLPSDERPVARALRTGVPVAGEEFEVVFPTGRRLSLLCSAAPIPGRRADALAGVVVAWVDITALKKLQSEIDQRRREAEEASDRKSRFLAAVSHDIRTPANAISLLAELMQRTALTPALVSEIPEIASDLKRSALMLVELVSDVLDLTRFDTGKVDLQESDVSVSELLSEESRQFQPGAHAKGLEFVCEPPPGGALVVRTDRVKLSRVLGNLISNAIRYTEKGRITVRADHEPSAHGQVGGVLISVIDTGVGIPSDQFTRIFDEFYQLKNSNSGRGNGGSGLGLAICRRLVESMGGTIRVDSEVGKGSTFTVRLPPERVIPG